MEVKVRKNCQMCNKKYIASRLLLDPMIKQETVHCTSLKTVLRTFTPSVSSLESLLPTGSLDCRLSTLMRWPRARFLRNPNTLETVPCTLIEQEKVLRTSLHPWQRKTTCPATPLMKVKVPCTTINPETVSCTSMETVLRTSNPLVQSVDRRNNGGASYLKKQPNEKGCSNNQTLIMLDSCPPSWIPTSR